MPPGFAFVFTELMFTGMSYCAAHPNGAKVIGWLYAASSVGTFVGANLIWFTTNKKDPGNKSYALMNSVLLLGMSYGFYRIADYNLRKSEGHPPEKRFVRNFVELHAAYIIPIFISAFVEKQYDIKSKKKLMQTSFMLAPGGAGFVVKF
jgi:hypothetical protein